MSEFEEDGQQHESPLGVMGRKCRVACVQMVCENLEVEKNISKAKSLVAAAAEQGAQLVLLPELMAAGYLLTKDTWEVAEPTRGGITERFLAKVTRKHGIYCGCTFLEAAGDGHFYNTFLLYFEGREMGRIRKYRPASFEAFIFSWSPNPEEDLEEQHTENGIYEQPDEEPQRQKRGSRRWKSLPARLSSVATRVAELRRSVRPPRRKQKRLAPGPHVIATPLGRIGVSICYESFVTCVVKSLAASEIDLLLMPFSCPKAKHPGPCSASFNASVDIFVSNLNNIPVTLAKMLQVPTMFANKTGPWTSPLPLTMQTISGEFPGGCTIASKEGEIVNRAADRSECVVVGDVILGGEQRWREEEEEGRESGEMDREEEEFRLMHEEEEERQEEDVVTESQIPDYKGYIFSPPWMIFCLWWVTEWLGNICYKWSSTRRQQAMRQSRLNLTTPPHKEK